jgi:predicted PurR-regulated permease PerM
VTEASQGGIANISAVLVVIGRALFNAIGLNPIIEFLLHRWLAVGIVTFGLVLAAASPIAHEIHELVKNYPRYKANIINGRGWAGRLAVKLHLTGYLKRKSKFKIPAGGVLGAGKMLLTFGVATVSVIALTIYFLLALPGVKKLWLSLISRIRRDRADLLTTEVFSRVGGFMLGNLLTSVISELGRTSGCVLLEYPTRSYLRCSSPFLI